MSKNFVPQTVVPGARRRIDPGTHMAMSDKKGHPLWDMPAPVRHVQHNRHERTGKRIAEPIMVPIYRGTSASYARLVKAQIRRHQRKAAEKRAILEALDKAELDQNPERFEAALDGRFSGGDPNA